MPPRFNRRQANIALLGGLLWSGWSALRPRDAQADGPPPKPKLVKYFTLAGGGTSDAGSWANAMPIVWLGRSFPLGEPGTAYFMGVAAADPKPIPLGKTLGNLGVSGAPGAPIQVQAGYIGAGDGFAPVPEAAPAFFKNPRPWSVEMAVGRGAPRAAFQIVKGASHLVLSGFRVEGAGAGGFIKFVTGKGDTESFDDIVIRDIHARDVGRVIETTRGGSLKHLTVENCAAVGIVRGFARFWDLSDSILRNLVLDADHQDAGLHNPCQLISLVKGSNVTFENIVLKNAVSTPHEGDPAGKSYIQGDGIVCERGTSNVTIRDCHASNMGDGGFDCKTTNLTIEDSSAESCKFGARIWSHSDNAIRRCHFKSPKPVGGFTTGCIQVGGRAEISDTTLDVGPGTCAFDLPRQKNQEPATVRMTGGAITLQPGARLVVGDKGGVLELKGVAINGVTTDKRIVL